MRWKSHVRFGGRAGETHLLQSRQGAPVRSHLGGDALDDCRRRVQQALHGHRGRKEDPLDGARLTLHTGADLLTDRQHQRLDALFADDAHVEVEITHAVYQQMIAAYRNPDQHAGRQLMQAVIDSLATGVPKPLVELARLGRTLKRRAVDVLAFFDRPGTSNGPTEAICECGSGWSGTSRPVVFPACDPRSDWPVSAVSSR
jgi:transposase